MKYIIIILLVTFTAVAKPLEKARHVADNPVSTTVNTDDVCADELLYFAQTLIGTPYHSAASNPNYGFDCSGFVSYVFKNFNFNVPRSSCEFIRIGEKIKLENALPGDVILFTGTSKRSRRIGHVAIVMSNSDNGITFIHSTSGKEHGVTITAMDKTYKRRFVQIIRLLKQNNEAYASAQPPADFVKS